MKILIDNTAILWVGRRRFREFKLLIQEQTLQEFPFHTCFFFFLNQLYIKKYQDLIFSLITPSIQPIYTF